MLGLIGFLEELDAAIIQLWQTPYKLNGNIFHTSQSYFLLRDVPMEAPVDIERATRFKLRKVRGNHCFQFFIWRQSARARFWIQFISFILVATAYQYLNNEIVLRTRELNQDYFESIYYNAVAAGNLLPLLQVLPVMFEKANALIDWIHIIIWPYMFYPVFLLPTIYDLIIWNTESREAPFHKVGILHSGRFQIINSIFDIIVCVCFLINAYLMQELINFNGDRNSLQLLQLLSDHYSKTRNIYKATVALGMFCLWMRVVMQLRASIYIGPLFKVIRRMVYDIAIFLVLFGLILLCFVCIGHLLFLQQESFKSLYQSFQTLFQASIGNFDYDLVPNDIFYDIFLTIFIVAALILLLNLLIAVLTNTYSVNQKDGKELYLLEILRLYQHYSLSETQNIPQSKCNLQFLKIRTLTVIIFHVFFIPFSLCLPRSRKLSIIASAFQYIPIIVFGLSFFFFTHILFFIWIAFFKALYLKMKLLPCCCPSERRPRMLLIAIIQVLFYSIFGLPILIARFLLLDTPHAVVNLFAPKQSFSLTESKERIVIPQTHWKLILQMLKSKYNRTPVHRAVPVSQINLQIRDLFNYTANYRDFQEIIKAGQFYSYYGETEVFMNIKRFLSQNSVEIFEDQPPLLYPKVLLILLEESKLLSEVKHLRKNKNRSQNLKFQQILRDLVQPKRRNTIFQEQRDINEQAYVERDVSIDQITQSRIHTQDFLVDSRCSLRKQSFVQSSTHSHILTQAHSTFNQVTEAVFIELPMIRSGLSFFVGRTTADPESKLLMKLNNFVELQQEKFMKRLRIEGKK